MIDRFLRGSCPCMHSNHSSPSFFSPTMSSKKLTLVAMTVAFSGCKDSKTTAPPTTTSTTVSTTTPASTTSTTTTSTTATTTTTTTTTTTQGVR